MGDVRPNLILAAVVAVTALLGLGAGATWAFVGGLTANLLTTDALGTIPLGLLLVAGMVTLLSRVLGRHPAGWRCWAVSRAAWSSTHWRSGCCC